MQIVIDIPEGTFESVKRYYEQNQECYALCAYVANGTPLPKGHGDLVDRDEINDRFYSIWKELESYSNKPSYKELLDKWSMCMDTATAIIEADTESEDKE